MKGSFNRPPLEYVLTIDGESWRQGEIIRGRLQTKNISGEEILLPRLQVHLAYGDFKKINNKDLKGFNLISSVFIGENISLTGKSERIDKWEFRLSPDAPITDNLGSLYLLFSDSNDLGRSNYLQLMVDMKMMLHYFLQHFVQFFRFKIQQKKNKKGWVEAKMIPPDSREMANVDSVYCQLRLLDKEMEIKYLFNVKALDLVANQAQVQKKKKEFEQKLTVDQYSSYGDAPNPEGLKQAIGSILKEVVPKILY